MKKIFFAVLLPFLFMLSACQELDPNNAFIINEPDPGTLTVSNVSDYTAKVQMDNGISFSLQKGNKKVITLKQSLCNVPTYIQVELYNGTKKVKGWVWNSQTFYFGYNYKMTISNSKADLDIY